MVDCVIGCWEVDKHSASYHSFPKTILDVLSEVEYLAGCGFSWAEACLFWDEVFIYYRVNSSKDEAFEKLIGVA